MEKSKHKRILIFLFHAFIGWVFCAAIMGIGMKVMSMQTTLIVHAIGGPLGFTILSFNFFKRYGYTTPLQTATGFVAFVIFMDFFLVAFIIMKNFDMFKSLFGTWIPFILIFVVTYLTGWFVNKKRKGD
jgi:hypothetical protein